jgi:hypothetical protein
MMKNTLDKQVVEHTLTDGKNYQNSFFFLTEFIAQVLLSYKLALATR